MTATLTRAEAGPAGTPPVPGRFARGAGFVVHFLPAAVTAAITITILRWYGVSARDIAAFAAYLVLAVLLPGTLVWRALRRGPGALPADVTGGAAIGYSLEIIGYVAARSAGQPRLAPALPLAILLAFLLVKPLRRFWRGSGAPVPLRWAWGVAIVCLLVLGWTAAKFFRSHGLDWPSSGSPYVDMPFHLALAGELRHHAPPRIPYVIGESLHYHWFVYADLAATSWATGIELQVLLLRLSLLPMALIFVVGTAVLATKLTGEFRAVVPWWTGPLAALLPLVGAPFNPYRGLLASVPQGSILDALWLSPTQTFGAMLAIAAVLLLIELLRDAGGAGRWAMLILLLVVITGAKATYQPLLLAGLVLAVTVRWIGEFRPPWAALAATALTVITLVFAQLVLFSDSAGGLSVKPLSTALNSELGHIAGTATFPPGTEGGPPAPIRFSAMDGVPFGGQEVDSSAFEPIGVTAATGGLAVEGAAASAPGGAGEGLAQLGLERVAELGWWPAFALATLVLLLWMSMVGGAWAMLLRPRRLVDPGVLICLGIVAAGFGAALTFEHPGASQLYFVNSARPYLGALAVAGLAVATAQRRTVGGWFLGLFSLSAGACAVWAGHDLIGEPRDNQGFGSVLAPLAVLAGAGLAVWLLVWGLARLRRRVRPARRAWFAVWLAMLGMVAPGAVAGYASPIMTAARDGWRDVPMDAEPAEVRPAIPEGAVEAGRWLRDHSAPGDLVATNAHCRTLRQWVCDNRNFWVSAYTERRVLVSGWGYTVTAHSEAARTGTMVNRVEFWDRSLLNLNDAAFQMPSAVSVGRLAADHGVRWFLVDRRTSTPPPELARFAIHRFTAGVCDVYELPPSAADYRVTSAD
ncbi:hypothetical protein J2S43_000024 [Catenuloplanes nepalensis]|uniref:Uncharacterized protein n=1 Tax=Catenuloplanes nepalensis TaxID=587533 RepID=A0ABT9MJB3_9ACTN|nr:hypothetical protein [Catenuloplanes nepalensis]MDP9791512.1 hypothetical protein [Catenuloplanes nepalensis]